MNQSIILRIGTVLPALRPSFLKLGAVKRAIALGSLALAFQGVDAHAIVGGPWITDDPSIALQKAVHAERARGNLAEAEMLYRWVISDADASPELVVRAKLMLAECLVCQVGVGEAVVAGEAGAPTAGLQPQPPEPVPAPVAKREEKLDLEEALDKLAERALVPADRQLLNEALFEGVAGVLGKHAEYFDPDELAAFQVNMNLNLVGIGAMLAWDEETDSRDELIVTGIVDGSPAKASKLQRDDRIVAIDGKPLSAIGTELHEMVKAIRGAEGETVVLTVIGGESGERLEVAIVRAKITLAEERMIEGAYETEAGESQFFVDKKSGIGAVRIRMFSVGLADALERRLKKMKDEGMRGLVIDLRGNGGGSLSECIDVASLFVGRSLVVTTKSRNGDGEAHEGRLRFAPYGNLPTVVLTDELTASAAEILAAALQDHGLAVVIGERTFGKGTVETIMALGDAGAMKFSIHEFYRPSGKAMKRPEDDAEAAADPNWGVRPDEGFAVPAQKFPRDHTDKQRFDEDPIWPRAIQYLKEQIGE